MDFLDKIDGIFAFSLYDPNTKDYFIARDHMGIIPLYIGWDENGVTYVASEMKSIEPYCEKLQEFPPGNYYKNGEFTKWYQPNWANEIPTEAVSLPKLRKATINLSVRNTKFSRYRNLIHIVEAEKNQLFEPLLERYPKMDIRVTGPVVLEVHQELYITESLYRSFLITIGVISLILLFLFGSIRVGLFVALIPNLFPIAIIFGLMGGLGFPLDTFTLVVVPVVIGIAVDDTIHFLTHFKLEIEQRGNLKEALNHTLNEVGQAVIFTSLILSTGLFFMTWATSIPISRFGLLGGIAILAAMLADLLLLPALCKVLDVRFESSEGEDGPIKPLNLGNKKIIFE